MNIDVLLYQLHIPVYFCRKFYCRKVFSFLLCRFWNINSVAGLTIPYVSIESWHCDSIMRSEANSCHRRLYTVYAIECIGLICIFKLLTFNYASHQLLLFLWASLSFQHSLVLRFMLSISLKAWYNHTRIVFVFKIIWM